MKVLIISSEELNYGNTLSSVFELEQAKALQRKGVEVAIISVGYISVKDIFKSLIRKAELNYRLTELPFRKKAGLLINTFYKSLFKKADVKKWKIDGVHIYEGLMHRFSYSRTEKAHGQWVEVGFKAFEKYSDENGNPDVVHAHSRFLLAGLLAGKIRSVFSIPYVLTEHSSFYARNLIQDFQKPLIKKVIEESDHFFVVSSSFGRLINKKLETDYSFEVLPNVLNSHFTNVEISKLKTEPFVVLNVAQLEPVKGQSLLLDAFKLLLVKIPSARLRIIGKGPLENSLKQKSNELGIAGQVCFAGQLNHDAVKDEMKKASCLVLTSRSETFGAVVTEALACGKPVVSTRSGGPEDIIHAFNGILVEHSATALADAMEYVHSHLNEFDPQEIRQDCLNRFGPDVIAERLMDVYKKIKKTQPGMAVV